MAYQYSNERIYKNLTIVTYLSFISLAIAIIIGLLDLFPNFFINQHIYITELNIADKIFYYIWFYGALIFIPLWHIIFIPCRNKPQNGYNYDLTSTIGDISISFLPWEILILGLCFGMPWTFFGYQFPNFNRLLLWSTSCGIMFIPHLLIYIADIFLMYNLVLIKREWCKNPPGIFKKQLEKAKSEDNDAKLKAEQEKQKQQEANKDIIYNTNIEICGIRFFIKYYRQITLLPLPDIEVTENYSDSEKTERLAAAKRIINLGLAEYAFQRILKAYSDILLTDSEIEQTNRFLEELKNKQTTTPPEKQTISERSNKLPFEIAYIQNSITLWLTIKSVILGLAWIPLMWVVPIMAYYIWSKNKNRQVGIAFGICVMLFVSIIAGALILCSNDKQSKYYDENADYEAHNSIQN